MLFWLRTPFACCQKDSRPIVTRHATKEPQQGPPRSNPYADMKGVEADQARKGKVKNLFKTPGTTEKFIKVLKVFSKSLLEVSKSFL